MISVRPTHSVAALLRLTAFLATAVSIVTVPTILAAAAAGHVTLRAAVVTTGIAFALSLMTGLAARSLDPLRVR